MKQQHATTPAGDQLGALLYAWDRERRDRLVLEMEWPETPPDAPAPQQVPTMAQRGASSAQIRQTIDGEEKLCTRCQDWWPNDDEFFYATRSAVQGRIRLSSHCKACHNECVKLARVRKVRAS